MTGVQTCALPIWEVDSPNTYHTFWECQVKFWCCWEVLEEAKFWRMQSGTLWDPKSWTRHSSEKPCWSRSLEGLGSLGRLSLEGLLLFMYLNWLSSGSIYCLEGSKEVLRQDFGFLFGNTLACYLVFIFFFPTLLAFILLMWFDEYGLD